MFHLIRVAFRYGRRFALLSATFLFMLVVTFSSQMEMLAVGVLTGSGPNFFSLFSAGEHNDRAISFKQVEERWSEIDTEGKGSITLDDTSRYMAKKRDRNPLASALAYVAAKANLSRNLVLLAGMLVIVALLKGLSLFGSQYTKQLVMIKVSRDLRQRYFEHIHTLPLSFYQTYNVGSLSSRVQQDAYQIALAVYSALTAYIQTPISVITSLALCLVVSTKLACFVFILFPIVILPVVFFAKRVKRTSRKLLRNHEELSSVLVESLSGIQTVKLFAQEELSLGKFRTRNQETANLEAKSARYAYLARPVLHMASSLMLASIILFGIYVARLSAGEVLVFCGLIYLAYEPIKRLTDENLNIQRGVAAAERMDEVLKLTSHIQDAKEASPLVTFSRDIVFDGVSFTYDSQPVLQDLTFTIRKGEMCALVGPTGAGKTTLVHLLPRLYDPQSGQILIDGRPLNQYTQQSLREQIAFVPQHPFFFQDTIADNIAFGAKVSREQVIEAAIRAHADEFIQHLPLGYDTPLAECAKNLSGGQQQRLAIARALVRGSPILILDEATSALDAVSELHIKQALQELRGSLTQIIIAHRLSTIEDADNILYLQEGRLLASGSRSHLLEVCPEFARQWQLGTAGAPPQHPAKASSTLEPREEPPASRQGHEANTKTLQNVS